MECYAHCVDFALLQFIYIYFFFFFIQITRNYLISKNKLKWSIFNQSVTSVLGTEMVMIHAQTYPQFLWIKIHEHED